MDGTPSLPTRSGRKRSEESRQAILGAALTLVAERGYAGLTIEGIAARSGAGKQTIYRWWPSKADVLLDALAAKVDLSIPVPDTGTYADDIRAFLRASVNLALVPPVIDVLRALMVQAQLDADFGARFRAGFLYRRREVLFGILDRAQVRGDLPSTVTPDTVADVVFGVIWYRVLATERPFKDGLVDELAHILRTGTPTNLRSNA